MSTNIGPKIGIDGEAEYRKQINDIIQSTKTLKSEYEKAASSIDNGSTSFKKNKEMSKALCDQIDAQKDKVEKLGNMVKQSADKFGESDTKTLKWKEALNKAQTELNNLEQTLKNMPNQVELLGNKFEAAGNKIKDVGEKVEGMGRSLAPLSTAAAGALTGSAKAAIDFESAFTGVRKTVEGTEEEFDQLSDWIKEASTQMASSKTDIAGTMEIAGQLGVTGVESLEAFTKTMVMLGDTTNLSSEEAASALAKFTNITGESNADIEKIGSSIVDLGNHFATTEADIVNMSTRMASAGKISGLSSTDILALSTAISSVGIEAEAGGTAMNQTLKVISMAVDGLDNGMEGVEKAQKKVTTASRSLEDAQDNLVKKQLAYDEAVRKYSESDAKNQEKAQKNVETATRQLDTATADMAKKQIAYNNAVAKYGEDSAQAQTALINFNQAQDKVQQKTDDLAKAQTALDAAMQGGTGSNEKIQKALIDLEAAQRKVEEKTSDLTMAQEVLMEAEEGGGSKLQMIADIAGMSADEFSEKWKGAPMEAMEAFISGLGRMNEEDESVIAALDELGLSGIRQSNMLQALALSSENLSEAVHTSNKAYEENNALQEEAEKRYSTTESKLTQAKEKISNVGIEIGERLLPYLDKGLDFLDRVIEAWDKLSPETQDMIVKITAITAALSPALIVGGKVISGAGSIVGGAGKVIGVIGKIGGALSGGGGLLTALSTVGTFITGTAIPAIGSLIAAAAPILAAAAPFIAVGAAIVAAGVLIYKNWDTIKEKAGELKDWVSEKFTKIKDNIANSVGGKVMSAIWESGKKIMTENLQSMKDKYEEYGGGVKGATAALFEGVKDHFTSGYRFLDDLTGGRLTEMANSFKDKFTNMSDTVKDKWNTIKNNTSTILDGLKKKVEENGGGIQGVIKTSTEMYVTLWKNAFNSIDEATGGKLTALKDKITTAFSTIKDKLHSIIDKIKGLFDFEWKFPDIKTPHFSLSGGEKPWGIGGKGSLPEFNVEWYSKAMNRGMLLTGATIFGEANGKLLGGGEAGNEIVIGETSLMSMIRSAVGTRPRAAGSFSIGDTTINIYTQPGQSGQDIADQIDEMLTARYAQMEAVWA